MTNTKKVDPAAHYCFICIPIIKRAKRKNCYAIIYVMFFSQSTKNKKNILVVMIVVQIYNKNG